MPGTLHLLFHLTSIPFHLVISKCPKQQMAEVLVTTLMFLCLQRRHPGHKVGLIISMSLHVLREWDDACNALPIAYTHITVLAQSQNQRDKLWFYIQHSWSCSFTKCWLRMCHAPGSKKDRKRKINPELCLCLLYNFQLGFGAAGFFVPALASPIIHPSSPLSRAIFRWHIRAAISQRESR